jgi:ADP-heptose:LPS heptosyltransferase
MHGLIPPKNLQINLTKYFTYQQHNKTVAVNLFAETLSNAPKVPSLEKSKEYCDLLIDMGFNVIQIGLPTDPQICENRFTGTFFDTIRFALGCDFVLTVDSAMSWIMSGYQHPVIGIYNYRYYNMAQSAKNWQPINTNAIYIEDNDINIDKDTLEQAVKLL